MRWSRLMQDCVQEGEHCMALPDIIVEGKKFWAFRYGPPPYKVGRLGTIPTGYTVMTCDNMVLADRDLARRVARLYRIWEEIYIRPYKVPGLPAVIEWALEFESKFYDIIMERKQTAYEGMEGIKEELEALQELDQEVVDFHEAKVELLGLDRRLGEIIFDLWDCPSDCNISEFIRITYRFRELMEQEKKYLERRLNAWQTYRAVLERKYNVKLTLEFKWGEIGFGAFIDLMKYLLWQHVIPEGVLTAGTYNVLRDTMKAKGLQMILNLLVHFGGIVSLEKHLERNRQMLNAVENYIRVWESGIWSQMIRVP